MLTAVFFLHGKVITMILICWVLRALPCKSVSLLRVNVLLKKSKLNGGLNAI